MLLLALGSLVAVVFGTLLLDWFGVATQLTMPDGTVSKLSQGIPMSMVPGGERYETLSALTLWTSFGFAGLVLRQAFAADPSENLTKNGYVLGSAVIGLVLVTAFMSGLRNVSVSDAALGISFTVWRTWAPGLLALGVIAGMAALYYIRHTIAVEVEGPDLATPGAMPHVFAAPFKSEPIIKAMPERPSAEHLRGKLSFVTLSAEVTRGGVDARREDGSTVLVVWGDVVGIVARRLPPALDGATFVDLISSSGSTLRVVPWTKLTGDPIDGEAEHRARAFIALVRERSPTAKLDQLTRSFVDAGADAAQLPGIETLAVHDERLA